jgi:hypothetical protein
MTAWKDSILNIETMEIKEAIEIVKQFNKWRRGEEEGFELLYSPKEIGMAIDVVLEEIESRIKENN